MGQGTHHEMRRSRAQLGLLAGGYVCGQTRLSCEGGNRSAEAHAAGPAGVIGAAVDLDEVALWGEGWVEGWGGGGVPCQRGREGGGGGGCQRRHSKALRVPRRSGWACWWLLAAAQGSVGARHAVLTVETCQVCARLRLMAWLLARV